VWVKKTNYINQTIHIKNIYDGSIKLAMVTYESLFMKSKGEMTVTSNLNKLRQRTKFNHKYRKHRKDGNLTTTMKEAYVAEYISKKVLLQ